MPHGHPTHSALGGSTIRDRVRAANAEELAGIPWLSTLTPAERRRAEAALVVGEAEPGDLVCRVGRSPTYWFGVVEGLLKMSNDNADGGSVTYTGVPPGGWFGEGSVIKRELRKYDVVAIQPSLVLRVPVDTFHALLSASLPFSHFVIGQLNNRMGEFIASIQNHRLLDADARVAQSLAQLFNPQLYPSTDLTLAISQEELGYLTGLSRQRVNQALQTLADQGILGLAYNQIQVLDLGRLRLFGADQL